MTQPKIKQRLFIHLAFHLITTILSFLAVEGQRAPNLGTICSRSDYVSTIHVPLYFYSLCRGRSRVFLWRGCTTLRNDITHGWLEQILRRWLNYNVNSWQHIIVIIRKQRVISGAEGGGEWVLQPLYPFLRSAAVVYNSLYMYWITRIW